MQKIEELESISKLIVTLSDRLSIYDREITELIEKAKADSNDKPTMFRASRLKSLATLRDKYYKTATLTIRKIGELITYTEKVVEALSPLAKEYENHKNQDSSN